VLRPGRRFHPATPAVAARVGLVGPLPDAPGCSHLTRPGTMTTDAAPPPIGGG
jgi:hypothetical protein